MGLKEGTQNQSSEPEPEGPEQSPSLSTAFQHNTMKVASAVSLLQLQLRGLFPTLGCVLVLTFGMGEEEEGKGEMREGG